MKILLNNNREISDNVVPYFIAEVNTSHFGDVEKAKSLIDAVKKTGADCVKFQSWSTDSLYSNDYYRENPIAKRFVKKFSLNEDDLEVLAAAHRRPRAGRGRPRPHGCHWQARRPRPLCVTAWFRRAAYVCHV